MGVLLLLCIACEKPELSNAIPIQSINSLPEGFPEIEYPDGNEYSEARWKLGKKLFFDPILSSDKSTSCASCHNPRLAFSDDIAFSLGANNEIGNRNSPTLANVAYHPYYTREGGVPTLEMQVLVPIQEHNELNTNIVTLAEILNTDDEYVRLSNEAYDRDVDAYVITRALANFERTLLSGNSPYDQYTFQGKKSALAANQKAGLELFMGKAKCSSCHSGFNFTNYQFENNGLYETYPDPGRYRLTLDSNDLAMFKVPTLRNISLTAPYMHDGSMSTLDEVVEHYNSGLQAHPNRNRSLKPLNLSDDEKADLLAFLESLTDEHFITNPIFHDDENH